MGLPRKKKLRVDPAQSSVELGKGLQVIHSLEMAEIPQDDLAKIFKYCPLRCRLRRVCRYWKHVVGLPEVNETTIVSWRCLLVSGVQRRGPSIYNYTPIHVWYNSGKESGQTKKPAVKLSDYRRHGLLGPHVRTLIYDGLADKGHCYEDIVEILPRVLRSIGFYCTGVEHIILWRLYWDTKYGSPSLPRRARLLSDPPSRLTQPQRLTVLASSCRLGSFRPYGHMDASFTQASGAFHDIHESRVLTATVPFWQDDASSDASPSDEAFLHQFYPPCTVDQRAWVARYAPRLPKCYHDLIRGRLQVYSGFASLLKVFSVNLKTGDYSQADSVLLRLLAHCILREEINMEPPPESFATYFS